MKRVQERAALDELARLGSLGALPMPSARLIVNESGANLILAYSSAAHSLMADYINHSGFNFPQNYTPFFPTSGDSSPGLVSAAEPHVLQASGARRYDENTPLQSTSHTFKLSGHSRYLNTQQELQGGYVSQYSILHVTYADNTSGEVVSLAVALITL